MMNMTPQERLGYNLKILRTGRNVNQNILAEFVGLTRSAYAQYELGNRTPDAITLHLIAEFHEVSMDLLFESNLERFLSEMASFKMSGDSSQELIENYRRLSQYGKGRLVEYSKTLLAWHRLSEAERVKLERLRQP